MMSKIINPFKGMKGVRVGGNKMSNSPNHTHLKINSCPETYDGRHSYDIDCRSDLNQEIEKLSIALVCPCGARARAYYELIEIIEGEI